MAGMDHLAHPFRVDPVTRVVATVADGSDEHHAQAVAVTVLTRKGERPLTPTFGLSDPTFVDVDVAELNATLSTFGPMGVAVEAVAEAWTDTTRTLTLALVDPDAGPDDEQD